jgi:aminopeptidase C
LKPSSSIIENEIQNSLKWAFEEGYKLGRDDGRDGVFIALDKVVDQFALTMPIENVSS